jgi:hypothetical protein
MWYAIFSLNLKSLNNNMKRFLTLVLALTAFVLVQAQTTVTTPAADPLVLKQAEHDFGKIPQGKPVYHTFEIVNTGTTPLKLDEVHASCGCTTPEWNRELIAPGATAVIKVGYNAAAEGPFDKPITITYNNNQTKQIKIKGQVWKAPEGAAPANAAVDFLKKQTF